MKCRHCGSNNPEVARYCFRCGNDLRSADASTARRDRYAANPNEPVASFALVSTIMPHASGTRPNTYRTALVLGLALPVIAAATGLLSFALVTAAFVVPVVYILYLYDVNLWEDEPLRVTVMAFAFTALMAVLFTFLWREVLFDFRLSFAREEGLIQVKELLIIGLLVPLIAEVLKQIGPVFLASRPAFDDLMDGLSFGVVSGVSFAAFETIMFNRNLIVNSPLRVEGIDAGVWVALIITAGLIKPIIYGTATGLAVAEYSGLGEGYDGLTPRYFRGFGEAVLANILFAVGLFLTELVPSTVGAILGMVWGLVIAGVLIIRIRTVLHRGLLESAVEAAARASVSKHAAQGLAFCSECEMPLLAESMFCTTCGASVRATSKMARNVNAADNGRPAVTSGG